VSALNPGLYLATVRGIPGESIVLAGVGVTGDKDVMFSLDSGGNIRRCYVFEDARPLIVLDLEDPRGAVAQIRSYFAHQDDVPAYMEQVADQIEAQTKPARIPEPGLWGVVVASSFYESTRLPYLHEDISPGAAVWSSVNGRIAWDDLIDPTEIREGLS